MFDVESILGQKGQGASLRYLVKWEGFPDDHNTWEPTKNVQGCRPFQEYLAAQQSA